MSIVELQQLSPEEKLKIIEMLWSGLAKDDESIPSPAWHEAELRKAEKDFTGGRTEMVDWEDAKRALRKRSE